MTINERVSPKKPLFAEVHNVPDDYRFTTEELDRMISGDMFTPRQDAIMARELQQYRAAAEPVAWMVRDIDTGEKFIRPDRSYFEGSCQPLYTRPHPAPVVVDFKNLARELVENLVDCSGADDSAVKQYQKWAEKTCRAAMLQEGK